MDSLSVHRILVCGHPGSGVSTVADLLKTWLPAPYSVRESGKAHSLIPRTEADQQLYDVFYSARENEIPGLVVVAVNSTQLRRELALASQVIDLHLPVMVVLTFEDQLVKSGKSINVNKLSELLGSPVVSVNPTRSSSHSDLLELVETGPEPTDPLVTPHWRPSRPLANAFNSLNKEWLVYHQPVEGLRLLEGLRLITDPSAVLSYALHSEFSALEEAVEKARSILDEAGENWTMSEISQRHGWLMQIVSQAEITGITPPPPEKKRFPRWTDRFLN